MKYSFKIYFTFLLMIICHTSFSQKSNTESKEIQEIILIFKDIINKKLRLPFYLPLDDGLTTWLRTTYPNLSRKISFLIHIDI